MSHPTFGLRPALYLVVQLFTINATVFAQNQLSKDKVKGVMQKVFEWQVANPVEINLKNNNGWARSAFYAGIMSAYRATGDKKYLEQATSWATERQWKLGERPRHADDHAAAQTYLELYIIKKDPERIA